MAQPMYKYLALDSDGKRCSGVIAAATEDAACRILTERSLTPIHLRATRQRAGVGLTRDVITQQDIATLTREMSVLVEANIPIGRGLRSIAEHERKRRLRDMVTDIANMIESGEKLTTAFGKYQDVFGDVYVETVRSAEQSGTLAAVTEHLADMLERNIETRSHIRRALTYPAIVIAFVALALTVIVVFVVPRFAVIFEANGVALPLATRVISTLGESVKAYWWIYSTGLLAGAYVMMRTWRSPEGRLKLEGTLLRLPYIGDMLSAVAAARFSRVLSIGLDSGIEVIEAMWIAGRSTGRPVFRKEFEVLCDRMRAGDSLESVVTSSRRLPSFARRLLSAGKDATELSATGRIIARHYDRISDHLAKNINTIIEPLITVAIAVIVLIVALSVFLPMWQMIAINK